MLCLSLKLRINLVCTRSVSESGTFNRHVRRQETVSMRVSIGLAILFQSHLARLYPRPPRLLPRPPQRHSRLIPLPLLLVGLFPAGSAHLRLLPKRQRQRQQRPSQLLRLHLSLLYLPHLSPRLRFLQFRRLPLLLSSLPKGKRRRRSWRRRDKNHSRRSSLRMFSRCLRPLLNLFVLLPI
jgi:hypothetical protein